MSKKVYIDFELKYKEAVANLDEMQKEYSKLEKEVAKTKDTQEELGGVLDQTTGGAITKFKGLKGSLGGVIKSFKTLRGAIIATGIGALIVAVGSLTAMFSRSEEGQNKFARILNQLGVIAGNVMDIFSDLGKVVFNVFTGNFKEAALALDDVTEGIKNFGAETEKEIKLAGQLTDMRIKADKEERKLITERAEANRRVAELREKAADKENVSVQERIEAIKEAGRIEEEITQKEIAAARLRFEAKKLENSLSKSTKEDLDEEAQLKARLTELETGRLKIQKALTAEITTALREEEAERKRIQAEKDKEEQEAVQKEEQRLAAIKKIQDDFEKKKEEQKAQKEFEKLELEKQRKLEELEALDATEAQKADIILYYNDLIKKAQDKDAEDEIKRQEQVDRAKVNMAKQTFSNIATAIGQNSKAGKAAAAAAALINTYQGITAELATKTATPFEFAIKLANIATTAAIGFKSVKDILATKPTTASAPSTASTARGGGGSQAPAFNIVGGGATSQLADVIAEQSAQPSRAYVVSNDVSTAQELDRNIIQGASIG